MEFTEWINEKYKEYRGDSFGHDKSVTEFAKEIGIEQSLMSQWMRPKGNKAKIPSSKDNIAKLVNFFGYEAYEALGLPVPGLSHENSKLLFEAAKELSRSSKDLGIDIDDPSFINLFTEVFGRHGIRVDVKV